MSNSKSVSKICAACGAEKPLAKFGVSHTEPDKRRRICRSCAQVRPTSAQTKVLTMLRSNGLTYAQVRDRSEGRGEKFLAHFVDRGWVSKDAEGFYELTPMGLAVCPYRNPHMALRLQAKARNAGQAEGRQ